MLNVEHQNTRHEIGFALISKLVDVTCREGGAGHAQHERRVLRDETADAEVQTRIGGVRTAAVCPGYIVVVVSDIDGTVALESITKCSEESEAAAVLRVR